MIWRPDAWVKERRWALPRNAVVADGMPFLKGHKEGETSKAVSLYICKTMSIRSPAHTLIAVIISGINFQWKEDLPYLYIHVC